MKRNGYVQIQIIRSGSYILCTSEMNPFTLVTSPGLLFSILQNDSENAFLKFEKKLISESIELAEVKDCVLNEFSNFLVDITWNICVPIYLHKVKYFSLTVFNINSEVIIRNPVL